MKHLLKSKLNFILFFFLFLFPQIITPQSNSILLFEKEEDVTRQVYVKDDYVFFEINGNIISTIKINVNHFNLLKGIDGNSIGIVSYTFGNKSDKTLLEIYLLDRNFKISFFKRLSFSYEEPLPKIIQLSSDKIILFRPALGELKILETKTEHSFNLLEEGENKFYQERIGYVFKINDRLIVTLSHVRKNDDFVSKIYSIDLKNDEMNFIEFGVDIIYKVFPTKTGFYFSAINIDPIFYSEFYQLEVNDENFQDIKISKIADLVIEGQVKNVSDLYYSKNCLHKIYSQSIQNVELCFDEEVILDAIAFHDRYLILTRKNLLTYLYEINKGYKIVGRETIERFLKQPQINIQSSEKMVIMDNNKIILEKNISEE
ncbi:MAG: hypothetical protein N3F03_00735 [Ignavibacteria bacterium]|nr:hypothetical protein [Ignavibacteria bacterium]